MPVMGMHELGFEIALSSHETEKYAIGTTFTRTFNVASSQTGSLIVRAGLSRCETTQPAGGATIGISQISGEQFWSRAHWRSAVYIDPNQYTSFTISAHVFRGDMRAWWYIQAWS